MMITICKVASATSILGMKGGGGAHPAFADFASLVKQQPADRLRAAWGAKSAISSHPHLGEPN
jgi:hypothetical protein